MAKTFRAIFAVALLVFLDGQAVAKKKPAPIPAPSPACADFYQATNQDWLAAHPLAVTANSYSHWDELGALADRQTRELIARSQASASAGPAGKLLADLVASGQDATTRATSVRATAKPLFARIDAIKAPKDIAAAIATLQAAGIPVVVDFDVLRDTDTGQAKATFSPAALGLPGSEFYTRSEPVLKTLLGQYRQSMVALLVAAGVPSASAGTQADAALVVETALAKAMSGQDEKVVAPAVLDKEFPGLKLSELLKPLAAAPEQTTVRQPAYFKAVDKMLAKPTLSRWQAYLRVRTMDALAEGMAEDPRRPYLTALARAPATTMPDRFSAWLRDEGADLLDVAYVDAFLGDERQAKAQAIGESVRAAMARAIDRATWLSPEGKSAANSKLAAMRLAIGQTAVPVSLDGLGFDRGNYAGNVLAMRRWNRARSLARLQAPRWPWPVDQTKPVVGFQETNNRLIVSAATLQPPVFDGSAVATDYGTLGALIGQQISLAFSNLGGNDGLALQSRMAGLVAQYSAYPVTAATAVDGQKTLRMNAADLAGLELAWDAYRSRATDNSGDQAFFRAWSNLWARQDRESILSAPATTANSIFAPARWRVNGPLANLPAFAQAYACAAGQPMARSAPAQVSIWR